MPFRVFCKLIVSLFLTLLFALPSPSAAQGLPAAEERHLEAFAGYYLTDADVFDDALSLGGRAGYRWNRFGLEGTLSRLESDIDLPRQTGELEVLAVDLSVNLYLNPGSRYEWSIFAGPGWELLDSSTRFTRFDGEVREFSSSDDTFTVHVGVALRFALGERLYLRPDLRVRGYDDDETTLYDVEGSLAVGYSFF